MNVKPVTKANIPLKPQTVQTTKISNAKTAPKIPVNHLKNLKF